MHAFGICGSQAAGHHRVPRRRLVDQAPASGLERARGRRRRRCSPRPASPAPRRCSRARMASTRRSPAVTTRPGSTALLDSLGRRLGARPSSPSSPIRAARSPSPTWTARCGCAQRAPLRPGDDPRRPCRTAAGPVPRLWEPLAVEARAAERLRREVQPALPGGGHPRARARGLAEFEDAAVARSGGPRGRPAASPTSWTPPSTIRASSSATSRSPRTDGRVLRERQDRPRGGPDAPLTREELEAKFRGNAAALPAGRRSSGVIRLVDALATGAPLAGSASPLSRPRGD